MEKEDTKKTAETSGARKASGSTSCCVKMLNWCAERGSSKDKGDRETRCCGRIAVPEKMLKMMEACREEARKKI